MRTEREMMALVLGFAERDERVRAVAMNGSRTNPRAPKDPFQDYDIVYLVTELDSFIRDPQWIDRFGERTILQTPEDERLRWPGPVRRYTYLMLFEDGNRIDLRLIHLDERDVYAREDKLTVVLLDKDGCLPALSAPTDEDYWVKRPTPSEYAACCNEFWWVSTYVAKGLWRKEMLYAQEHLHSCVRPMLIRMLEWKVGVLTDFSVSAGKCGKYLERYLPADDWQALLGTYPDGSYEETWRALFAMGALFRDAAESVGRSLHYEYPREEDTRVTAFLRRVEKLPSDAKEI